MRTIWKIHLPHNDVLKLIDPKPLHVGWDPLGYAAMWVEHTLEDDGTLPEAVNHWPFRYAITAVATGDPVPLADESVYVGTLVHTSPMADKGYVTHFYFVTVPVAEIVP